MSLWSRLALVVAVLIAAGALLTVAWLVESRKTEDVQKPETVFTYTVPEREDVHRDILIHCSEDEAAESSKAFAKWEHLEGIPLEFPGGPLAIAKLAAIPMGGEVLPAQRSAVEILKRYSPKRIILVAHSECLYYDTISAWQDELSDVEDRQQVDLRIARKVLREWFPKSEVRAIFAQRTGNTIRFVPIEE